MTLPIILIIALLYLFLGYYKGIADTIQHSEDYRDNGWKAKWELDADGEPVLERGKMVEKFPGSSTTLVWLTDKWHLANFMQYRIQDAIACTLIYVVTESSWSFIALVILPALRYIGFKQAYREKVK
jgi:hypothetical protein